MQLFRSASCLALICPTRICLTSPTRCCCCCGIWVPQGVSPALSGQWSLLLCSPSASCHRGRSPGETQTQLSTNHSGLSPSQNLPWTGAEGSGLLTAWDTPARCLQLVMSQCGRESSPEASRFLGCGLSRNTGSFWLRKTAK